MTSEATKRAAEPDHDVNRCCFCGLTIEWQDDWCEQGSDVPCEVAHVACCSICTPTKERI